MRKWLLLIIAAALTVAVVVPTPAGAASKTKCSVNLTILSATVKSTGSPPLSGTQTNGGIVDGKLCGKQFRGASRGVVTFTGPGKAPTAVGSFFGPWGSYQTSGSFPGVPHPDGSVTITGSGKITGGTGLYRAATGSFSATGTRAPSGVFTIHYTETIKY